MPLFPDLTIVIVLCGGVIVYLLTKLLNSRAGYKERKSYLLLQYQNLRKKSLQLQENLSQYILSGDHLKETFTDGMTYGEYLKYLQKNHVKNLSEKGYAKVKNSNNRLQQKKVGEILSEQEIVLKDAEDKLKLL
ncbi:hypothetical protein FMM05_12955 [Flavobacterium zepuense]|uniref:Uncharacterized protein n=1 Tax=Flavobacterium zepuense TaxID=2593302 RepID=A0A552UZC2_9FLAO|nr:hypothetical protein [Flavobacterium zepuense]TRW23565.1 hypothetical protein FMM05_12955 [Flavobacterium zepuense]